MKSFLKKILPWHLRQTLSSARIFHAKRKPTFEGAYARFADAPAGPVWRETSWTASSRAQAERWRAEVGSVLPESAQFSKALLPLLTSALGTGNGNGGGARTVRILDFGGGAGLDYAHVLAALGNAPGLDIAYHVVDMPESCEAGREVWAGDPRVSFGADLPGPEARFDIVYAFCSVFLVEDFRDLLATFARYEPAHILFCKTPVHEGPSFVRRQVNLGKSMENPQWALGLGDLVRALEPHGYALTYRGYGEDSYNVDNYDAAHGVGRMANVLFSRRPPE